MAIQGVDRAAFEDHIRDRLSPTTPIRSSEHLHGRLQRLEEIRRSLVQPGRHIFIYGDRGVGKTSLAQTAAFEHQSAEQSPILLGCDAGTTFYTFARDLASQLLKVDKTASKTVSERKGGVGISSFASAEAKVLVERGQIASPTSMNEVVELIAACSQRHSKSPVVVIDEFERVLDQKDRGLFADFIKQVGDQSINIKLVFCGVGASLDELMDAHHSCYRYLTTINLERLGYDPRLEIIDGAFRDLSVNIDHNTRIRIAMISDGFPYYIHLITEKILWEVFSSEIVEMTTSPDHYMQAVAKAVHEIEPRLKSIYEKATLKYGDEYGIILWGLADHHELKRRSTDIYESYVRICQVYRFDILAREKFNGRMNRLKSPAHGGILIGNRQGWYEFKESVVRGYVRLRAEDRGVQLGSDHPMGRRSPVWRSS